MIIFCLMDKACNSDHLTLVSLNVVGQNITVCPPTPSSPLMRTRVREPTKRSFKVLTAGWPVENSHVLFQIQADATVQPLLNRNYKALLHRMLEEKGGEVGTFSTRF